MSIKIGHAVMDENGKIAGGAAGDQTGKELATRAWYASTWHTVLRANDPAAAKKIAAAMQQACSNNAIGYDQHQRTTLFSAAQKFNFDLSKITVKCETDCSALVAVCINAAGISVSKDIYTGNMVSAIVATGKFSKLTDSKYLKSDVYLQVGDIVVKNGHTLIVLENGSKVSTAVTTATVPAYPGRILNATGKPFKRDEAVVTLQKRLRELDYYNDDLDGKFGPLTLEAVKAFQKRCIDKGINMGNTGPHKNGVDGSVGTLTWARLWE